MMINTPERLTELLVAQRENEDLGGTLVPHDFYHRKIEHAWRRASRTDAYRDSGAFSWDAFLQLPVTAKSALKSAPWRFAASEIDASLKYYETTGTTGGGTPAPRLPEDIIWNVVSVASAWRELLGDDQRVISLLPSDVVPVGDLVASVCEYLGVPHARAYPFATGISDWDRVIRLWQTLQPTSVFVAPGVALQLTRLLQQRGLLTEISASVRTINLLGEVSSRSMRARLGQWWTARVYDASYGSTETGTLGAACTRDNLHVLAASHYLEVRTQAGVVPVDPGVAGRLIVTPLNLHARPLLRYDTGDDVTVSGDCPCGSPVPVLTVLGRATDSVEVRRASLSPRLVEDLVYELTSATGYLLDVDEAHTRFRLLLERFPGQGREAEAVSIDALRTAFQDRAGVTCDAIAFVNTLPSTTKSGASQKSWKRSNVRVLEGW